MKIAVMQPYLFPYIGYFHLIKAVDRFIIYDDVKFISRGWINRNRVIVNGSDHLFTVPLKKSSQNRLISDIELSDIYVSWKEGFYKTLHRSYASAPLFNDVFPVIKHCLDLPTNNLVELIEGSLRILCEYVDIPFNSERSSRLAYNRTLDKVQKIIDICNGMKATTYINLPGGRVLYKPLQFDTAGIQLYFIDSFDIFYEQGVPDFLSNLSIIDVMMHNDKKQLRSLLNAFALAA